MTYMYVEHVPVQNKWKTKWQNIEIHFKIFDINHLTFTAFLTSLLQTVYGSSSLNHGHQEQRTLLNANISPASDVYTDKVIALVTYWQAIEHTHYHIESVSPN